MRVAFVAIYFAVSLVLLTLTFRIDEYLRNSMLSKTSTIVSYLIVALLLTIVAAYLAPWAAHILFPKLSKGSWTDVIATVGITFALFCLITALFGPLGVDLPGTRIRGIFFSEWKFTNFIFYDTVLLSLFNGALRRFGKY